MVSWREGRLFIVILLMMSAVAGTAAAVHYDIPVKDVMTDRMVQVIGLFKREPAPVAPASLAKGPAEQKSFPVHVIPEQPASIFAPAG